MTYQSEQNNIQDSFDSTLKDSNLQDIGVNFAEIAIDSIVEKDLLRELPIVATLVSLGKLGANIHDKLFLKKILSFLNSLKDMPSEDRNKMICDIDNSKQYRISVGEKLLYIIDKSEDYDISELVGLVFKYFIERKITYSEFLKASSVLNNLTMADFKWFVKEHKKYYDLDNVGDMINSGLFVLHYEPISVSVEKETDHKMLRESHGSKFNTDVDGGVDVDLSRSGDILLEIFCPTYKKPKTIKL